MKYDNWRGLSNQLINIPVCNNKGIFDRMSRYRRFIDRLPEYIRGENKSITDADVCYWIIKRLSTLHEEQFVKVGDDFGYSFGNQKMDAKTAQAM